MSDNMNRNQGIYAWKWNARQLFDCQRDPYFPKAGCNFTAYELRDPIDLTNNCNYTPIADDYIKLEYVGRFGLVKEQYSYLPFEINGDIVTDYTPVVKLVRYKKGGSRVGDLSKAGLILGLDAFGTTCFLAGGEFGYLLTNEETSQNNITYMPNVSLVTDEKLLLYYTEPEKEEIPEEISEELKVLEAEAAITAELKKEPVIKEEFTGSLVHVDGSTVTIKSAPGCTIKKVAFNINEKGGLKNGIWKEWSGFQSIPYKKKASDFTWENVPDGIYTFVIWQKEKDNNIKDHYELACVSTKKTDVENAQYCLAALSRKAHTIMTATVKESEAKKGNTFVSDATYQNLEQGIANAEVLLQDEHVSFDKIKEYCYTLFEELHEFEQSKAIK